MYSAPRGRVTVAVPPFWSLRQTNDDLEIDSPTGATSVVVTAFKRTREYSKLDAREYLNTFLDNARANGSVRREKSTAALAEARFRDAEGDHWNVRFITNGDTLLLATCSTSTPPRGKEAAAGLSVLESVKLKKS